MQPTDELLEEAKASFVPEDKSTWPLVSPSPDLVFVDRHGKVVSSVHPLQLRLD